MSNIQLINNKQVTMSSREIANLCSSTHDNVLKTIRRLIEGGIVLKTTPNKYINEQNKQEYIEFLSDKRDSLVIVARLSPEFTAQVIDRWQELENQSKPKVPTNFKQALILAVEQQEIIEQQQIQLIEQAPKVEFYDTVMQSDSTIDIGQLAKILNINGIGRTKLFNILRKHQILDNKNIPYQKYITMGWFKLVEITFKLKDEIKIHLKPVVFQKGADAVLKLIQSKNNTNLFH